MPLEVLLRGIFDRRRFLDLLRYFIVFEDDVTLCDDFPAKLVELESRLPEDWDAVFALPSRHCQI